MQDLDATIVAVATPPGRGGIGCVRVSGPSAEEIGRRLFRPLRADRSPAVGGRPQFGTFLARDGEPLDHGYLVLFAPGASFTGEPVAELWAHGSPAVLVELLETAVAAGARPSGPGEFTYRALRHGRIDLPRAEAVRDLVAARTLHQARLAFAQADGALSRHLAPLRESLIDWIARAEAAVEFVDESETHLEPGGLARGIEALIASCDRLLAGFEAGRLVRDGASLVIAGRPNVGKSSLFNALLARERAIVTEIAGTTRDTLEEPIDLGGIPARLTDTAGLRESRDRVESEGVRRAEQAQREADLILLVLDASRPLVPGELEDIDGERTIIILNKCDLPRLSEPPRSLHVSARTGEGIENLRAELHRRLAARGPLEAPIMTDSRHALALREARAALERAAVASDTGLTEEVQLEDLKEALGRLGEITGEFGTEELYDRIFSTFCIGK